MATLLRIWLFSSSLGTDLAVTRTRTGSTKALNWILVEKTWLLRLKLLDLSPRVSNTPLFFALIPLGLDDQSNLNFFETYRVNYIFNGPRETGTVKPIKDFTTGKKKFVRPFDYSGVKVLQHQLFIGCKKDDQRRPFLVTRATRSIRNSFDTTSKFQNVCFTFSSLSLCCCSI